MPASTVAIDGVFGFHFSEVQGVLLKMQGFIDPKFNAKTFTFKVKCTVAASFFQYHSNK